MTEIRTSSETLYIYIYIHLRQYIYIYIYIYLRQYTLHKIILIETVLIIPSEANKSLLSIRHLVDTPSIKMVCHVAKYYT